MISLSLENPPSKSSPKSSRRRALVPSHGRHVQGHRGEGDRPSRLSSSLSWVSRKSSLLEPTLMKSSSDSILVEAGVTKSGTFFSTRVAVR